MKPDHARHVARVADYLGGDPSRPASSAQRRLGRANRAQEAHLRALRRMSGGATTGRSGATGA